MQKCSYIEQLNPLPTHVPKRVINLVSEWGITWFMVAPLLTEAKIVGQGYPQGAIAVHAQGGRAKVAGCLHTPHFLTSPFLVSQSKWLSCGFWTNFLCQWGYWALPERVAQLPSVTQTAQGLPCRGKSWVCIRRMRGGLTAVRRQHSLPQQQQGWGARARKSGLFLLLWRQSSLQSQQRIDPLCRILEASFLVLAGGVGQLQGGSKGKKQ